MFLLFCFRQLVAKWFADSSTAPRQGKRERPVRYRPTLEILEDRLAPAAITALATFDGANGVGPNGGLIEDASGNLFGVAVEGGAYSHGTVFELKAGSSSLTVLASFDRANGATPQGPLVADSHGDLFGTTVGGGLYNDGTVFELKAGSGTITTLATFDGTNGSAPNGGLVGDGHGNLFGTATSGGANNDGTVFELKAGAETISTIATFNGTNGYNPNSALVEDASGNLFGTSANGWVNNAGTGIVAPDLPGPPPPPLFGSVFEVKAGSGTITTLATFDGSNGDGSVGGLVINGHGDLFGTTVGGGAYNDGTVFELKAGGGTITTLASFAGTNGAFPRAGLAMDASGTLFGSMASGRAYYPALFELKPGSGTITSLATFDGSTAALYSQISNLIVDGAGNLFGTTDLGTVFEVKVPTAFVHNIYEQLLHRAPESAGLAYWADRLNSGVAASAVVLEIEQSTEYLTDTVTSLYQQLLARTPDPAGLQHWVNQLASGASIQQVTALILASPEYFSDPWRPNDSPSGSETLQFSHDPNSTNASFVEGLYRYVLGRGGSAAEVQSWINGLSGGMSRFQVASDFLASQEYGTHLIDAYYSQFLRRTPEAGGLANWLQQLQAGASEQTILAGIFGSAEGYGDWS